MKRLVVKRLVERHQGRLWLDSTSGEGATFYFTLTVLIDLLTCWLSRTVLFAGEGGAREK